MPQEAAGWDRNQMAARAAQEDRVSPAHHHHHAADITPETRDRRTKQHPDAPPPPLALWRSTNETKPQQMKKPEPEKQAPQTK